MPTQTSTCIDCGKLCTYGAERCRSCSNTFRAKAILASLPDPNPSGLCMCGCGQMTPIAKVTQRSGGIYAGRHVRFLTGHHSRLSPVDYIIEDRGYKTPCWIWQRTINPISGYPQGHIQRCRVYAHRMMYEQHIGPIPDGLDLDHLCRVRACVNPDHLEPVTRAVNLARGNGAGALVARTGFCKYGHPFSGDNLYISPKGERHCRECRRLATQRKRDREAER